jgi:hypothetical protein
MDLEWHAYIFTSIDQDVDGPKLLEKFCAYGCMPSPLPPIKVMCHGGGFGAYLKKRFGTLYVATCFFNKVSRNV